MNEYCAKRQKNRKSAVSRKDASLPFFIESLKLEECMRGKVGVW